MPATNLPSIAHLQRIERGMTKPPWRRREWPEFAVDGPEYPICIINDDDDRRPLVSEDKAECDDEDAYGIAYLRNAAPVLLEIAAATLAWQTSPQAKARQARAQLLAALGKVAP